MQASDDEGLSTDGVISAVCCVVRVRTGGRRGVYGRARGAVLMPDTRHGIPRGTVSHTVVAWYPARHGIDTHMQ